MDEEEPDISVLLRENAFVEEVDEGCEYRNIINTGILELLEKEVLIGKKDAGDNCH
jgi:hypothetical protein